MAAYLISQGIDVNVKNDRGRTPIYYAIAIRHYEMTQFLIKKGGLCNNIIDIVEDNKPTWLCKAVMENNFSTAEFLIRNGADINYSNEYGFTPLHYAATNNNFEMF